MFFSKIWVIVLNNEVYFFYCKYEVYLVVNMKYIFFKVKLDLELKINKG